MFLELGRVFLHHERMHMNRAELVDAIVGKTNLNRNHCEQFVTSFIDVVESSLVAGEDVKLVGFGTFSTAQRKARIGRNPQTGQEVPIPARVLPVFKPGTQLKEVVAKAVVKE
jgi:DNA-binding protein HU-beta